MRKVFVPASGSVIAKQSLSEPSAIFGRKRSLTSGEPFFRIQALSMAVTSRSPGENPLAQISSKPMVSASSPAPLPPYSSGTRHPCSPTSAKASHSSCGKRFSRRATSRNSSRRDSNRWSICLTEARSRLCSSPCAKFVGVIVVVIRLPPDACHPEERSPSRQGRSERSISALGTRRSSPLELRQAFLLKGARSLAGVLAHEHGLPDPLFDLQRLRLRQPFRFLYRALDRLHRKRPVRRYPLGDRPRRRQRLPLRDDPADEPDAQRLLRRVVVAGEQYLHRLRVRYLAPEAHRRAAHREEPPAGLRDPEGCASARHADVGGLQDRGPTCDA